ncbi:hypothetical protein CLOM_g21589 [Closterium sp. NIES-68]|nr:hypothetical protein CLOM_g21589 [Closterium sp. NIES-68]GJP59820.1 hypothetical protein CLOP_g15310 [Closterium sp. NIES-67]
MPTTHFPPPRLRAARSRLAFLPLVVLNLLFATRCGDAVASAEAGVGRTRATSETVRVAAAARAAGYEATATTATATATTTTTTTTTTTPNTSLVLLPDNPYSAKCLDGSPPGYYFRAGTGEGQRKWHVFLAGGGWCLTGADCQARSKTYLGSTKMYPSDPSNYSDVTWMKPGYDAILSTSPAANPTGHNWNLVRLIYCDGGGYAGTKGRVKLSAGTSIYLDGWNIFRAVVQDLRQNRCMEAPSDILLSGSSAGGQAVVNLCDWLAASFPNATTRCLVDSGFFMDAKDRLGKHGFRLTAQSITALHRPHNPNCTFAASSAQQWKCFFPQYTLRSVATPVFIFHTLFDYIAAMLGNQLPRDNTTYAANCVREVINNQNASAFEFIRLTKVSIAAAGTAAAVAGVSCKASEKEAVLGVASALHNQIVAIVSDRPSIGAYIPTSSVHTAATNRFWTTPWINGTSVSGAFESWSRNPPKDVAVLLHD